MIRVLLDTNVLVSALISGQGAPAALLDLWEEGEFDLVVSPILLAELRMILAAPRLRRWVTAEDAHELVSLLERSGDLVSDPNGDDFLFAAAIAGRCDAMCSGDLDLFAVVDPPIPVLSPADLVEHLPRA